VEDVFVLSPAGADAKINGIALSNTYLAADKVISKNLGESYLNGIYTIYLIPQAFPGEYDTTVKLPFADVLETTVNFNGSRVTINEDFALTDSASDALRQQALSDVTALYDAAILSKDYSAVSGLLSKNASSGRYSPEAYYEQLVDNLTDRITLNSISIKLAPTQKYPEYTYADGVANIRFDIEYTYKLTYTSSGEAQTINETSPQSGSIQAQYAYVDGKWILADWPDMSIPFNY
jgi:hypothetical protein